MHTSSIREWILPFVLAGSIFAGMPVPAGAGQSIVCESHGGQRQYCRVGVHGSVSLSRQLSRAACIQGETWGEDGTGIWVSGGCRGEFRIDDIPDYQSSWMHGGGNAYGGGTTYGGGGQGNILCESRNGKRQYCSAFTGGGVHLVRQLSRSECIYQQSWGYDSGGVWVSNGCRAEFAASAGNYGSSGGNWESSGSDSIRCGSKGGKRNYCSADTRNGISMKRQLSHSACIQGQSWGYDGGGVWVSNGCRAEFQLGKPGHHGEGHGHHNNTAAVAAGALVLGALVAVASKPHSGDPQNGAASSADATSSCRDAIQRKVREHYGRHASVDFGNMTETALSGSQHKVEGSARIKTQGRSWNVAYTCTVDDDSLRVLESHILD